MLGLGNSLTGGLVTEAAAWAPTDVSGLEIWLTARPEDVTAVGTAVTTWTARFPVDGSYAYTQSTTVNKPRFLDDAVVFDATGSDDDVLLEASDELTLDTSDGGWTVAMQVTSSDWDRANQVIDNVAQTDTENFTATNDFIFSQISGKNNLSQPFTGSFKEIVIFNEELSEANRLECYNYMK